MVGDPIKQDKLGIKLWVLLKPHLVENEPIADCMENPSKITQCHALGTTTLSPSITCSATLKHHEILRINSDFASDLSTGSWRSPAYQSGQSQSWPRTSLLHWSHPCWEQLGESLLHVYPSYPCLCWLRAGLQTAFNDKLSYDVANVLFLPES